GAVESDADHIASREGFCVFRAPLLQPGHQLLRRLDAGRHVEHLLGLADFLAHPGEVKNLDGHGHLVWRLSGAWPRARPPSGSRSRSTGSAAPKPTTAPGRSK